MNRKRKRLRKEVKSRDGYRCRACGSEHDLTVHHIVASHESGRSVLDNLITLCRSCHSNWHRNESNYYRIRFFQWLAGGTTRQRAQQKGRIYKRVILGRWTGSTYAEIVAVLSRDGLTSPRGREWTAGNLCRWINRNAPELSPKRSWKLVRWPIFAEPLATRVWRWYFFAQPLGICHLRGEDRVFDKYNFSRYRSPNQKVLNTLRPSPGVFVCRGDFELENRTILDTQRGPAPPKQSVGFLSGNRLRMAKFIDGRYLTKGPIRRVPEDWALDNGWQWVPWEKVETILLKKALKNAGRYRSSAESHGS